jgi:hypothetical protein
MYHMKVWWWIDASSVWIGSNIVYALSFEKNDIDMVQQQYHASISMIAPLLTKWRGKKMKNWREIPLSTTVQVSQNYSSPYIIYVAISHTPAHSEKFSWEGGRGRERERAAAKQARWDMIKKRKYLSFTK